MTGLLANEIKCILPLKWCESYSLVSGSLWPHGLYSPWNSPGQNTGVGSLSLLQGIFPTQGLNPGLLHCRRILYQLSHREAPLFVYSRHLSEVNAQSGAVSLAMLEASFLLHWVRRGNKLCKARAFPVDQRVKNLPAVQETWLWSLGEEDPPEEGMATTPVFLLGEFHG